MKQTWLCCTMCFKPQTALSSGGQAAALSARRPSPKVRESYVVLSFLFFVNETLGSALDADACFTAWQLEGSFKGRLGSGSLPRFLSHFLSSFRFVDGWGGGLRRPLPVKNDARNTSYDLYQFCYTKIHCLTKA